jgi:transformation/transcription domain-associated protein
MVLLKGYQDQISNGVLYLLKDCPPDSSSTRKELLVAARHLWHPEFGSFMSHIDILLDEDLLVGTGVTCRETLRPHAISVLVDLIHNVRHQLTFPQISRIIYIHSRNLLDPRLAPSVQTMSGKLLFSIIENIIVLSQHPPEEGPCL